MPSNPTTARTAISDPTRTARTIQPTVGIELPTAVMWMSKGIATAVTDTFTMEPASTQKITA